MHAYRTGQLRLFKAHELNEEAPWSLVICACYRCTEHHGSFAHACNAALHLHPPRYNVELRQETTICRDGAQSREVEPTSRNRKGRKQDANARKLSAASTYFKVHSLQLGIPQSCGETLSKPVRRIVTYLRCSFIRIILL